MSALNMCNILRRAGYKPHAQMMLMGERLELISYPFPLDNGLIACKVRELNDPTTMFEWVVPEHVINAAVQSFGETK